jgi:hypothetical protein
MILDERRNMWRKCSQFKILHQCMHKSRGSAVGTVTAYGLDDRGVEVLVPVGSRIFTSTYCINWLWGPPSLLFNGYPGLKQPGREAGHSPPPSVEVKKTRIYTFPHTSSVHSAYLVKHRDNFTFTSTFALEYAQRDCKNWTTSERKKTFK